MPFNGGAVDNLALLTPGVLTPGDTDFTNGIGISANGNRGRSNNFQIDGQDNNDNSVAGPSLMLTNTEAVGAFQVITNTFSAEFGRNSGAQINIVTKGGTNQFHGSVFEYLQNSAINTRDNLDKKSQAGYAFLANNGFSNFSGLAGREKDPFTNNRFGGSLGGPIKQNKAFFFVTYQGDRQRGEFTDNNLGLNTLSFTPESAALAAQLFPNPATAALTSTAIGGGPAFVQGAGPIMFSGPGMDTDGDGVIDQFVYDGTPNNFSPGLFVNVNGVPTPLYFGEATRLVRNDIAQDQVIGKVDINITDKDVVGVRYIYDNARFPLATGRFLAGAIFDVPSQNNNLGVTYTRTISPRFVNEARFNFSRLNVEFGDPDGQFPGPGIQFSGTRNLNGDLSLTFGTPNNIPQSRLVDVYQYQDTVSATLGVHGLKFGADIRQQKVKNFFLPNFLGTYSFNGASPTTVATDDDGNVILDDNGNPLIVKALLNAAAGQIPSGTPFFFPNDPALGALAGTDRAGTNATAFENFLLGRPRQVSFALGDPSSKTNQDDFFFFLQDDWRIRPTFTLITTNFIYDVPFFQEQRGTIGKLLGGYQLSSIMRFGSGRAYSPINAFGTYDPTFENGFVGLGGLRPFNGNPNAPDSTIAFGATAACGVLFDCSSIPGNINPGNFIIFNTRQPGSTGTVVANAAAAMQQARAIYNDFGLANQFGIPLTSLEAFQFFKTPFGDMGRNTLSGLPFYLVNFALSKTTNITEQFKLEFRVEANNLLNHRNFGVPDPVTEDAFTGFAVGTYQNPGFNNGGQRELRFGLKLNF